MAECDRAAGGARASGEASPFSLREGSRRPGRQGRAAHGGRRGDTMAQTGQTRNGALAACPSMDGAGSPPWRSSVGWSAASRGSLSRALMAMRPPPTAGQTQHNAATPSTTATTSAVSPERLRRAGPLRRRDCRTCRQAGHRGPAPASPTWMTPWSSKLGKCVGIRRTRGEEAPTKVDSPDFTSADEVDAVEDSASVYPSAAQAQAETPHWRAARRQVA